VGLYVALHNHPTVLLALTALLILSGFYVSSKTEDELGRKDPHEVVIDEFSAQLLVFAFLPYNVLYIAAGFIMFRILDVLKPPPVRRLESLPKGWGIMLDDLSIAVFINIVLQILNLL